MVLLLYFYTSVDLRRSTSDVRRSFLKKGLLCAVGSGRLESLAAEGVSRNARGIAVALSH